MLAIKLLYLHNSSQSRLQAWQMLFFHLNALLDLFFWGQWFLVFFCQPESLSRGVNSCFMASEKRVLRAVCDLFMMTRAGYGPLPLFKLPVQSCQCELMGIGFREVGPWNVWRGVVVKLFLRNQVDFFMFRPGIKKKNVNEPLLSSSTILTTPHMYILNNI